MKLTDTLLRNIIKEELQQFLETPTDVGDKVNKQDTGTNKQGKEKANIQGTLNTNKLAEKLGVDPSKFLVAFKGAMKGSRSNSDNAMLADAFIKLVKANPDDKAYVMNLLRGITEKEDSDKK